jgi:hypothetical protein
LGQKPPTLNIAGQLVSIARISGTHAVIISETFAGEIIGRLEGIMQKNCVTHDVITIETRDGIPAGIIEATTGAITAATIVRPVVTEATIVRLPDDIFATDLIKPCL